MNRKRALAVSCALILLCITIIAGMTYALFSETETVHNHLQAGDLSIAFKRTDLKYKILDENGSLTELTAGELLLSRSSDANVFGLGDNVLIAPGSYFDAGFEIENTGDVVFDYSVTIKFLEDTDLNLAFARQLKVTLTSDTVAEPIVKTLDEFAEGYHIAMGKMQVGDGPVNFRVRVDFVDDAEIDSTPEDEPLHNNEAKNDTVLFDLTVVAIQATK